jgi:tetratricopeptide (TPR) repeat protein
MEAPASEIAPKPAVSRLPLYALFALALFAHGPGIGNTYIWDDDAYVTENKTLRTPQGLADIWLVPGAVPQYYPLVHTSFWIEYQLWGLAPAGYHVNNILLHAASCVLLFLLLKSLDLRGAWWIAAIFAVHPVTVESVGWVTERKNVLSALFFFAALLTWWRGAVKGASERPAWRIYAMGTLAFVFFVLALLSKTVACSMPAVVLVLLWWKRRLRLKAALALLPFFLCGLLLAWVTVRVEQLGVGATGTEWAFTFGERCLIAGRALWFYACKVVWPLPLIFIYPRWQIEVGQWWQQLYPLAYAALLISTFVFSGRLGRGLAAALMLFAGTLLPALGFIDVYPMRYSFVADHFQYVSSIVPIALLVQLACVLGERWRLPARVGVCVGALVLIACGALTWRHTQAFYSTETLWEDTLAKNPKAWIAHNNLGLIRMDQEGGIDAAIVHFRNALRLKPDHANASTNLGLAYERLDQHELAEDAYTKALDMHGNDHRIHALYADFLARRDKWAEAASHYQASLAIWPRSLGSRTNLGRMLAEMQRWDDAAAQLQQVLDADPGHLDARLLLARVRRDQGDVHEALKHYQILAQGPMNADPEIAYEVGRLLLVVGDADSAKRVLQGVIMAMPGHAKARLAYARALQAAREYSAALAQLRSAVEIAPRDGEILQAIAWDRSTDVDASQEERRQARMFAERVIQLSPSPSAAMLDCLAAAQAANGDFTHARVTIKRALDLLPPLDVQRPAFEERLSRYQQQRAYVVPRDP